MFTSLICSLCGLYLKGKENVGIRERERGGKNKNKSKGGGVGIRARQYVKRARGRSVYRVLVLTLPVFEIAFTCTT